MAALVILKSFEDDLLPYLAAKAPIITWAPSAELIDRLDSGEKADGIFALDYTVDELSRRGKINDDSRRSIVESTFGLAVGPESKFTAPQSSEELTELLLSSRRPAISRSGASGIYFEQLIDRLSIGDEIRNKALYIPSGLTGLQVRDGQADLAVQQISELKAVNGIKVLGPLPAECQKVTRFDVAIFTNASNPDSAVTMIECLTSSIARHSFTKNGLQCLF